MALEPYLGWDPGVELGPLAPQGEPPQLRDPFQFLFTNVGIELAHSKVIGLRMG